VDTDQVIKEIKRYEAEIKGILSRFSNTSDGLDISGNDDLRLQQNVLELRDLFNDILGENSYSGQIIKYYNEIMLTGSPSYRSVENILATVRAALTRLNRNPELIVKKKANEYLIKQENIFIIHGRDEAKWRELKDILHSKFRLNPIILQEQPDNGCKTIIEKFEKYAQTCSYAIALFTPDDEVKNSEFSYLQARPNVIYELGWFCGMLGRSSTMLLLKEGTSVFSDFGGIIQKRFIQNISEKTEEIKKDLISVGILNEV
jgi:predicted nucleotide-binding protein